DTTELFNSGGDLKLEPDVQGNVTLFEDTDVADDDESKHFMIYRKAAEFDSYLDIYLDSYGRSYLASVGTYPRITFGSDVGVGNDKSLRLGDNGYLAFSHITSMTNDSPWFGAYTGTTAHSGYLLFTGSPTSQMFSYASKEPSGTTDDLTIRVCSSANTANEHIEFFFKAGGDGYIQTGSGDLILNPVGDVLTNDNALNLGAGNLTTTGTGTFGSTYIATLGDDTNSRAGYFYDSTRTVYLADGSYAGSFDDGSSNYVYMLDGSYGISVDTSGSSLTAGQFSDGTRTVYLADGSYAGSFDDGNSNYVYMLDGGSYGIYVDTSGSSLTAGQFYDGLNNSYILDGTYGFNTDGDINTSGNYYSGGTQGVSDTYDDGTDTQITFTGGIATSISTALDERLMEDITPISDVLDYIDDIRTVGFKWNEEGLAQFPEPDEHTDISYGFVAQDFETNLPMMITEKGEYITYNKNYVVVIMMKALQELKARNDLLEDRMVKWENVKEGLIEEIRSSLTLEDIENNSVDTGGGGGLLASIKSALEGLGLFVWDGVAQAKEFIAEKITTKTARIDRIEMVDQSTGDIYCTWIENGEWVKVESSCDDLTNPNGQNNLGGGSSDIDGGGTGGDGTGNDTGGGGDTEGGDTGEGDTGEGDTGDTGGDTGGGDAGDGNAGGGGDAGNTGGDDTGNDTGGDTGGDTGNTGDIGSDAGDDNGNTDDNTGDTGGDTGDIGDTGGDTGGTESADSGGSSGDSSDSSGESSEGDNSSESSSESSLSSGDGSSGDSSISSGSSDFSGGSTSGSTNGGSPGSGFSGGSSSDSALSGGSSSGSSGTSGGGANPDNSGSSDSSRGGANSGSSGGASSPSGSTE
ncbi:MAG: tail fiber domain-containing protein, partial [Candidatus Thorarchaeota archaeon]